MSSINAEEARAIAKEAFIYGFPHVENFRTLHKQALKSGTTDYRAPLNAIGHLSNVATPDDKFVVTPNSDTPYSFIWMDLRAEPLVITMPEIETERYYSGQLIDLHTHNFAYLGTRAFGNGGGKFVIAGPDWNGAKPDGVDAVINCETQIAYALFRTQLFNPDDIENVKKIQAGYNVQTLSQFLGTTAPEAAPALNWPEPTDTMSSSIELFDYLNCMLQFCPTHSSEEELMKRFAKLNIGAGLSFDFESFSAEEKEAIAAGLGDVKADMEALMLKFNSGQVGSGDIFGTRDFLKNNYLYRFAAAKLGLYGNTREEALYPTYFADAEGNVPDTSKDNYTLHFEKGKFPPADAFWSLTMYDGKSQFLVANPINRYLINSTMLDSFVYGDDGSLTIYVQKDSPGKELEANWLPAPDGPFYAILRLYLPKQEVITGEWVAPKLKKI